MKFPAIKIQETSRYEKQKVHRFCRQKMPTSELPSSAEALRDELDGTVPGAVRTRHQYTRTAGHVTLVEVRHPEASMR